MAYFSAYFDESYQEGSLVLAVSGYLATDERWIEFAERWDEARERLKAPMIHWSHLETFQEDFARDKGWDEARRLELQKELIPIIKETISCGICIAINVPEYDKHLQQMDKPEYETAYVYAVRVAIALTAHESKRNGWMEPVAYLIERSIAKHKKQLRKAFSYVFESDLANNPANKNRLESLTTDANRIDNVPLQAADVVAYETWKDAHNVLVENCKRRRRGSLLNLIGAPHLYGNVDGEALKLMSSAQPEFSVRYLMPDDY